MLRGNVWESATLASQHCCKRCKGGREKVQGRARWQLGMGNTNKAASEATRSPNTGIALCRLQRRSRRASSASCRGEEGCVGGGRLCAVPCCAVDSSNTFAGGQVEFLLQKEARANSGGTGHVCSYRKEHSVGPYRGMSSSSFAGRWSAWDPSTPSHHLTRLAIARLGAPSRLEYRLSRA